jgi:hypothetical protein
MPASPHIAVRTSNSGPPLSTAVDHAAQSPQPYMCTHKQSFCPVPYGTQELVKEAADLSGQWGSVLMRHPTSLAASLHDSGQPLSPFQLQLAQQQIPTGHHPPPPGSVQEETLPPLLTPASTSCSPLGDLLPAAQQHCVVLQDGSGNNSIMPTTPAHAVWPQLTSNPLYRLGSADLTPAPDPSHHHQQQQQQAQLHAPPSTSGTAAAPAVPPPAAAGADGSTASVLASALVDANARVCYAREQLMTAQADISMLLGEGELLLYRTIDTIGFCGYYVRVGTRLAHAFACSSLPCIVWKPWQHTLASSASSSYSAATAGVIERQQQQLQAATHAQQELTLLLAQQGAAATVSPQNGDNQLHQVQMPQPCGTCRTHSWPGSASACSTCCGDGTGSSSSTWSSSTICSRASGSTKLGSNAGSVSSSISEGQQGGVGACSSSSTGGEWAVTVQNPGLFGARVHVSITRSRLCPGSTTAACSGSLRKPSYTATQHGMPPVTGHLCMEKPDKFGVGAAGPGLPSTLVHNSSFKSCSMNCSKAPAAPLLEL